MAIVANSMTNQSERFINYQPSDSKLKPIRGIKGQNGDWQAIIESSRDYLIALVLGKLYTSTQLSKLYKIPSETIKEWTREFKRKHNGDQP